VRDAYAVISSGNPGAGTFYFGNGFPTQPGRLALKTEQQEHSLTLTLSRRERAPPPAGESAAHEVAAASNTRPSDFILLVDEVH